MKSKNTPLFILTGAAVFMAAFFYFKKQDKPLRTLPYYDPKNTVVSVNGQHHTIPSFTFTDQNGKTVTEKDVAGKIYVCDYFFTTCHSICPIMSKQMERVYKAYKSNPQVLILSHTVDPETDTVAQMMRYAQDHGVDDNNWLFLTGPKKELYDLARRGYLLNAEEGDGGEDDFIHTENFALIDRERHIRGYYDGTDSAEVSRLITDMDLLLKEYAYKEKSGN